ncbi:MAG: penicillin acylase family protein [Pirellulaceae bacterium]|nr:penicillin acylase family protein [Pirellulaceae bacterium]
MLQAKYFEAGLQDGVTEVTWRERVTLVESLLAPPEAAAAEAKAAREAVAAARSAYDAGDHKTAFATVAGLIEKAAAPSRANPPQPAPPLPLKATVYRDVYGVPHLFADSEESAAYAIAQAQCEDMGMRVFDNLRAGIGRTAEVFGQDALEADRIMHLWRVPETAERMWGESPPRTKRFLQAFCDGLNDYRQAHADECRYALEADPVQVLALFRWSDIGPSNGIAQLCANTGLKLPPPQLDFPNQSSTWVIGPSRTASGRPIVFIDPHWPAEGQTSWWEFHVHAGRLQAGGFALPGLPMVGLGYTDGAAWAATAGGADSADVFELKTNPKNHDQYWYDGQWRDMAIREVAIRVKNAAGTVEERRFKLRESLHGPLIAEQDGRVLAGAVYSAIMWSPSRSSSTGRRRSAHDAQSVDSPVLPARAVRVAVHRRNLL